MVIWEFISDPRVYIPILLLCLAVAAHYHLQSEKQRLIQEDNNGALIEKSLSADVDQLKTRQEDQDKKLAEQAEKIAEIEKLKAEVSHLRAAVETNKSWPSQDLFALMGAQKRTEDFQSLVDGDLARWFTRDMRQSFYSVDPRPMTIAAGQHKAVRDKTPQKARAS